MSKTECVINGLLHELDGCMFRDVTGDNKICEDCSYKYINGCLDRVLADAIKLLKDRSKEIHEWVHIWDAPDGSFKGKCDNCGFVHFFVEAHDGQYTFCPQCGEQKKEL